MNVNYIRAAIEYHTGIRLTLKQTVEYLLEEKLVTKAQAAKMRFPGYVNLFPSFSREKQGEIGVGSMAPLPVDAIVNNPQTIFYKTGETWKDS